MILLHILIWYLCAQHFSNGCSLQCAVVQPYRQIQEDVANGYHASTTSMLNTCGSTFSHNNGTLSKCESYVFM